MSSENGSPGERRFLARHSQYTDPDNAAHTFWVEGRPDEEAINRFALGAIGRLRNGDAAAAELEVPWVGLSGGENVSDFAANGNRIRIAPDSTQCNKWTIVHEITHWRVGHNHHNEEWQRTHVAIVSAEFGMLTGQTLWLEYLRGPDA